MQRNIISFLWFAHFYLFRTVNDLRRIYNFRIICVHFMFGLLVENEIHLYYLITLTHFNWVLWLIYCHLKSNSVSLLNKYYINSGFDLNLSKAIRCLLQLYFVIMENNFNFWVRNFDAKDVILSLWFSEKKKQC